MAVKCRYPSKVLSITQGYTGSYSHAKNYNGSPRDYPIDENCGSTGRSYFYAPFDCIIKRIYGVGSSGTNTIWLQSLEKVQTPKFTDYVTVMVIHPNDDTLKNIKVGQTFSRGQAMFLEGTDGNATGNHFHISAGRGKVSGNGWRENSKGAWVINTTGGSCKPEDVFFVDADFTTVKNKAGISFKMISGTSYTVGQTYTIVAGAGLKVRKGAGTSYAQKKKSELTKDGQKHAKNKTMAVLKKDTDVTCKAVKTVNGDTWMQIPSGWICAIEDGDVYVG